MICSQFTGRMVRPSMRMVPSATKPSMRGSSGFVGRAHIGPVDAAHLLDRIGRRLDLVAERALFRLVRLAQALAAVAELPAVIGAADAVLGRDAVRQRSAAVRAGLGDQPHAALLVAEQHQVLAEEADAPGPFAFELGDRCDRVPVAAHQNSPQGVPGPIRVQQLVLHG